MKKSHRYLRGTFNTLAVALVALIAVNRFAMPDQRQAGADRTPETQLATLKDFVNVRAQGDFALVVRQQPGFSVQYVAAAPSAGQFHASIQGDTLSLGGYGNIGEDKPATVIVGMPHLQRLVSIADIDLTVEGFDDGEPAISANQSSLLTLRGNSAPTQVRVQNVRKLQLDAISQTHATLHVSGNTVIVPLRE